MTEKDKELIEKASKMHYTEWSEVSDMEEQAESEEAKAKLHSIATTLYHREEYHAGLL